MPAILRRCAALVPFAAVVPFLTAAPPAPQPAPRGYVCLKASAAPTIDGKLDDEAWKAAPWSDDFVDIEGDKKPKPRHRTRMKMLWDDKALYIAAELTEPDVWATITEHDAVIFQDPDYEVFLDPDGDNHHYAELEVNARNATWDLLLTKPYKDGGKALTAWEIVGLKTAVQVQGTLNDPRDTDRGWTVEIAWPWAGLKELTGVPVPPGDSDRWRVNFSRVEWNTTVEAGKTVKVKGKPENNWVWSPQGVIDMHRPERWGYLQFSTKTIGPVDYRPDPAQATKDALHEVYYAQRDYHAKHGHYARTVADLGLDKPAAGAPEVHPTKRGYDATLSHAGKLWGIADDAVLWTK